MYQFSSLFKKNFLYWKRDTCCCTCQIVASIVFALFLVLIKQLSKSNAVVKEDTTYLNSRTGDLPMPFAPLTGSVTPSDIIQKYVDVAKQPYMMKDCRYIRNTTDLSQPPNGGYVALHCPHEQLFGYLKEFFDDLNFPVQRFATRTALEEDVRRPDYAKGIHSSGVMDAVCFGISFDSASYGNWKYNLHHNVSGPIDSNDIQGTDKPQQVLFKEEDETSNGYSKYQSSGIITLQSLLDNLILRIDSGVPTSQIQARYVKMPVERFVDSGLFAATNNGQIDIYIVFPLVVIFLGFIYHMLKEKELKITENLRNMGMSMMPYYLSWFAYYHMVLLVCSLLWAVIGKISFFENSNFLFIWLVMFLPGLVMLSLAFIVCSFFVTAKPGVLTGIVLFFIMYGFNIGKMAIDVPTEMITFYFGLSPFTCIGSTGANLVLLESINDYGFSYEHVSLLINFWRYRTMIYICLAEYVVFFLLGIYLDQVWPTEIGIKKHPLFFLGCEKHNRVASESKILKTEETDTYTKANYESLSQQELQKLKDSTSTIQIRNLRKVYSNGKVAVHDLTLDMFDNQIFAMLGHNGAGKTTTISMISGLLTQTSGLINICGLNTTTQYSEIKKILGVCPQLNPLYSNLTCREHLELYGNLKLQGRRKITEKEIDQILTDIDLFDKKDYLAGRLSGGQKRKLCIGIAFIGDSKVILLDEPTSGMDTFARRYLWEMIKKYKKDRVIILCTHYMDEADFLGDRFGIMGEGRLITCGSSLFLKKRFGVGYDLTIVKQSSTDSTSKLDEVIKKHIPDVERTGDISMEVKYRLPTQNSSKFEELFKDLEVNKKAYNIQSFGISLTTLEEVFLKVAVGMNTKEDKPSEEELRQIDDLRGAEMDLQLEDIRIKSPSTIFWMHFWALFKKRLIYFKRDYKGVFCEIVLPIAIITVGLCLTLITFIKDPIPRNYTPSDYFTLDGEMWTNTAPGLNPTSTRMFDSMRGIDKLALSKQIDAPTVVSFQSSLIDERNPNRMLAYYLDGADNAKKAYSYTMFYNTTNMPIVLIGSNVMNNAAYKAALNDPNASIKVQFVGLKLTLEFKTYEKSVDGIIAVFLFALAYAFIPAGVMLFVVKERENNAKHQQIVSGVSIYAYWLSNMLIDVLKYWIPGIYCALSAMIFHVDAFTAGDSYGATWAIVILYGPAIMAFTYATSFLFKSPESAQISTFIFNFLAGFVLMVLSMAFRFIQSTRKFTIYFPELFFRLLPTFDFAWGMFGITSTSMWQFFYSLPVLPKAWSRWGALIDVIYLLILPFVYMGIVFYIELRGKPIEFRRKDHSDLIDLNAGDDDVKTERKHVLAGDEYAIEVKDFVKEYKMVSKKKSSCLGGKLITSKVAVKGVTFGVKRGECFGLLGTNGAGKTTTFKALSGEIQPTHGVCKIAGLDLAHNMSKVRYLIGYCPQFDALLDRLTAREHLELYAAIKGIPHMMRERLIQEKLVQLNLKKFENVQAGTYSGGNKRKLSVAIALLGNPPIILLDEPSSGMDPEARRFMWSIVGKISTEKKHSSVVLTTHSMEEAEALSTKLAIMVEGSIECIGPVQKLKNKYGKGFEVEVKIEPPSPEEVSKINLLLGLSDEERSLNIQDINTFLDKLSLQVLKPEVNANGKLASLAHQVSQALFVDQAILHMRVRSLEAFLQHHFGQSRLIESVNSFFRYQLPEGLKISQLFGELERNVVISLTKQHQLKLAQYSVKQTTIEQIFINFANQRNVRGDD